MGNKHCGTFSCEGVFACANLVYNVKVLLYTSLKCIFEYFPQFLVILWLTGRGRDPTLGIFAKGQNHKSSCGVSGLLDPTIKQ